MLAVCCVSHRTPSAVRDMKSLETAKGQAKQPELNTAKKIQVKILNRSVLPTQGKTILTFLYCRVHPMLVIRCVVKTTG
jgi:hypothetical protein